MTVYVGALLTPSSSGTVAHHPRGALLVSPQGTILAAGRAGHVLEAFPRARRVHLPQEELLLPGLVDCHAHVAQYPVAGRFDLPLLEWLEKAIYPVERRFEEPRVARAVSDRFVADLLRGGTTTAALHASVSSASTEVVFRVAERRGLRAVVGKVMMDRVGGSRPVEVAERSVRESERLCRRWNGRDNGRLLYAFTPRFAPACSPKLLAWTARAAERHGARVQTHLAESVEEVALVRRRFPKARSYTEVYARAGLLGPRSLFAHAVHLSSAELDLLARTGSALAHCPQANLLLGSGLMDAEASSARGLRVGLGSDVGAGAELDMFRQMASACYVAKALRIRRGRKPGKRPARSDAERAFYLATLGGARALGLGEVTGSLSRGKAADFLTVDVTSLDPSGRPASAISTDELLALLAYRGSARAVRSVFVGGTALVGGT